MDLSSNPFFFLGASVRDDSRRLIELAEERSLTADPKRCNEVRASLTNPRRRLVAEIAWLPGVSPSRAQDLAAQAKAGLINFLPSLEGLPSLAACNVLAWALSTCLAGDDFDKSITTCIRKVVTKYEEVKVEDVSILINEDRAIAGFPAVQGDNVINQALLEHRNFLVNSLREGLGKLNEPDFSLTELAAELTEDGECQAPLLLEELTAKYQIEVAQHLDSLKGQILKLKDSIEKLVTNNKRADILSKRINRLEELLRQWDRITKPMQLIAKSRGIDEEASANLAAQVRNLAIFLANKFGLHEYALQLSSLMSELFIELPQLEAQIEEDITTIQDILENKEKLLSKTPAEKEKWGQEIALDIMIGKDRLTIDAENISYLGPGWKYSAKIDEVDRVRWGIFKDYTSTFTRRKYTIWIGSPKGTFAIECVRFLESETKVMERFQLIINKLWKAVCIRLVIQTLSRLSSGENLRYGDIVVDKEGVLLPNFTFRGVSSVHYPWEDLSISSGAGYFKISATKAISSSADLSYRDVDNVHILETIMRFLWKDGNYAKLRNGEFL